MSSASSAGRADPRPRASGSARGRGPGRPSPRTGQGTGRAAGPWSPAWPLALARRRDAERRVAGAARVATEILDDVLGALRIAGGSGALQTRRLRFHLLGGALELWPLLPDFRLRLRLVG